MCVPLKKYDTYKVLFECLDDIKAWMAFNFLNKKTQVMVFGGARVSRPRSSELLGSALQSDHHKPRG